MSFFAILLALLIEQVRPLGRANPIHHALRLWTRWVSRSFDAGQPQHGWVTWGLTVLGPALAALAIHWALMVWLGWPAAALWNVVILYVTLGFRQFSHHFTNIRDALERGDEDLARQLLAQWRDVDSSELPRSEIVRHVIEYSVLSAHRHVFGVLGWYSLLAAIGLGPAGAVVYRMSEFASRYWQHQSQSQKSPVSPALQTAARQAWMSVDWLPARVTALGFAVVGSFEDAIDGWRNHAQRFPEDNDGVILAATAGAVNLRLGGEPLKPVNASVMTADTLPDSEGFAPTGRPPELAHLAQIVGLVWRSVVMWMVLLALLTLARLLG